MKQKPSHPETRSPGRYAYGLLLLLLVAGILAGGWSHYKNHKRAFRALVEHKLMAIAELKVLELTEYRSERFMDAEVLNNPIFAQEAQHLLDHAEAPPRASNTFNAWLATYIRSTRYDQIRLMDDQCVTRYSIPADLAPADASTLRAANEVLKSGRIVLQDFYRNSSNQRVYLALMVPILDAATPPRTRGVLVLRIDPTVFLYPFLQRWPASSESGETLLIRRESNSALFLNELRFKKNTALILRSPLSQKKLPAAMAVMGTQGIVDGLDYRNVPVIAALSAIPDSPWFMVAKMDASEVYKPLHEHLWQLIFMLGALVFGAATSVGLIWRNQHAQFYKQQTLMAKALDLAQATLRAAMDQCPVGIAIADAPDGTLSYVNDAGLLIRGGERDTIVNDIGIHQYVASWRLLNLDGRLLTPEEVPLTRAILFGEACSREFFICRDNGEKRLVVAKASPILNQQDKIMAAVVVFMDITEHRCMEQELLVTLADLKRSNKHLEQFAYVASHDLQEPLRMVTSYTQLLAKRYENQIDADGQKYIHYAVDGAMRMHTLINDLLAYSRIKMPIETSQSIDIKSSLDEAIRNLNALIVDNHAIIDHENLPTISANASLLVMLFQNLIANAIKFHGADPPHIQVSAQDLDHEWLFAVKDNGIGIEPQYATRVFEIFQRLHTREEYPGTGIGLAICQRIVHLYGGKIWFESTPGHGTVFYFTLSKQLAPTHP